LHEIIRRHSQAAAMEVKMHGRANDLLERPLQADPAFANARLQERLDARRFVGLAAQSRSINSAGPWSGRS